MTVIPKHVRHNFEKTEESIYQLRALLLALDHMAEAANPPASPESDALFVLITTTQAKLRALRKAHSAEWAGHGGETSDLSEAEIAAARGESGEAAQ